MFFQAPSVHFFQHLLSRQLELAQAALQSIGGVEAHTTPELAVQKMRQMIDDHGTRVAQVRLVACVFSPGNNERFLAESDTQKNSNAITLGIMTFLNCCSVFSFNLVDNHHLPVVRHCCFANVLVALILACDPTRVPRDF